MRDLEAAEKRIEKNETVSPDEGEQGGTRAVGKKMSLMDLIYPLDSSRPFRKLLMEKMKGHKSGESSDSSSKNS